MARQFPIKNRLRKTRGSQWFEVGFGSLPLLTGELQLEHLERYIRVAENSVASEREDLQRKINQLVASKQLPSDQLEHYEQGLYDSHQEDFWMIEDKFPWLVYSGSLIIACSLFESSLIEVCTSFDRDPEVIKTHTWSQIKKKSPLKRAGFFLSSNFGIQCNKHKHWSKLSDYYSVRNCIVHANGNTSRMKNKNDYPEIVSRYSRYDLKIEADRLKFTSRFIWKAVNDMKEVWRDLRIACIENEVVGPVYWP